MGCVGMGGVCGREAGGGEGGRREGGRWQLTAWNIRTHTSNPFSLAWIKSILLGTPMPDFGRGILRM